MHNQPVRPPPSLTQSLDNRSRLQAALVPLPCCCCWTSATFEPLQPTSTFPQSRLSSPILSQQPQLTDVFSGQIIDPSVHFRQDIHRSTVQSKSFISPLLFFCLFIPPHRIPSDTFWPWLHAVQLGWRYSSSLITHPALSRCRPLHMVFSLSTPISNLVPPWPCVRWRRR